jgi:transcriptional regulator with XRE-family HTH domain
MDARSEIREFLTTRRARITPDRAGLTVYGGNRRVPGLRREEVALLAGVSADYYTRIERGNMSGVSAGVLEAIAAALQLDEAERAHLFDLVRAAQPATTARRAPKPKVRPGVQSVLDALQTVPAYVGDGCLDVLATNHLGRALYADVFDDPVRPANLARFIFLNPLARDFFPEWERVASDSVGLLRSEAGRDPHNRCLMDLVGELSTQSEDFRTGWAAHNVRFHDTGTKCFRHPVVGELTLSFEALQPTADQNLRLVVYTAQAGSRSAEALALLASWTATEGLERTPTLSPPSPA